MTEPLHSVLLDDGDASAPAPVATVAHPGAGLRRNPDAVRTALRRNAAAAPVRGWETRPGGRGPRGDVRPRVLVVDDDRAVRAVVRDAMEAGFGAGVEEARDGEAGLLRAWARPPDLVLADLLMPGMDGATFVRLLREHPATAGTPVVAISGADPYGERARALRGLCAAWVGKPFGVDRLLVGVRPFVPRAGRSAADRAWAPLTPRQRDVAVLVARGRSNYQLARALVLDEGTAANHVRAILLKLGLESRTQLAVWVAKDARRRADAGID
jgi:DNA-binding NarL/FixJ family response regulator